MNDAFGLLPSDITAIVEVLEQQTAVESAHILAVVLREITAKVAI